MNRSTHARLRRLEDRTPAQPQAVLRLKLDCGTLTDLLTGELVDADTRRRIETNTTRGDELIIIREIVPSPHREARP